jgi:hypothetical protein
MSKRGYISRYLLILKKLKVKPYSTYEELQAYIENQFDYLQMQDDTLNIGFSKRTLQRDIKEIRNVFGIDIEYSKSQKGVSTFASHTNPSTDQSLQKSFHLSHADKIELKKISSPSENKKYATAQPDTTKTEKHSIDNGLRGQTTRTTGYNSGFAKKRVHWLIEHSTSHQHLC